jgi:hypothetical protein
MEVINSYFKDLIFTRVDEKQGFIVYGAGLASGLAGGIIRYVLLFVPKHYATKNQAHISELKWQNIQTRELPYSYRLKRQVWVIPRGSDDILLHIKDRTKTHSEFYAEGLPFEILLLHNPKKKTLLQYHDKITLTAAIETFNMVCSYTGGYFSAPPPIHSAPPQNISYQMDDSFEYL